MTHPRARRVLSALAAMIALAAAGCRSEQAPAATVEHIRGEPAAVVVIGDSPPEFEPATITVKVGETVEWRNTGSISHSVDFLGPRGVENSQVAALVPNAIYTRRFDAPGIYTYACRFHIINGMKGKVVVLPDEHNPPESSQTSRR